MKQSKKDESKQLRVALQEARIEQRVKFFKTVTPQDLLAGITTPEVYRYKLDQFPNTEILVAYLNRQRFELHEAKKEMSRLRQHNTYLQDLLNLYKQKAEENHG